MKRLLCITSVLILLAVSFMGCAAINEKTILGQWQLLNDEGKPSGVILTFEEDQLRYSVDTGIEIDTSALQEFFDESSLSDMLSNLSENIDTEEFKSDVAAALEKLDEFVEIQYTVDSASEMTIKISALFGVVNKSQTVEYSISGNTLTLDGAQYERIK